VRMSVTIRRARVRDAEAIVIVLRRSITELCVDDHRGDPAVLDGWLENKTAANVRSWIEAAGNFMVVAEEAGGVCGVALLSRIGMILLCYVLPELQYRGVGHALLRSVEEQARVWGLAVLSLESTVAARGFYAGHGYKPEEGAAADSPLLCKVLTG
jgi:GNAT superfamily N-acetyltransferase